METAIGLNVAFFISVAVLFPLATVAIGCAYCRKLCRGNEEGEEDRERQPLLSGQREERETGRRTIEDEQVHRIVRETETAEIRDQQEAEQVPDVVRVDEPNANGERTGAVKPQAEPDILEPRPLRDVEQARFGEESQEELVRLTEPDQKLTAEPEIEQESLPSTGEKSVHPISSSETEEKPIPTEKAEEEIAQQKDRDAEATTNSNEQQKENLAQEIEQEQMKLEEQPDQQKEDGDQGQETGSHDQEIEGQGQEIRGKPSD